MSEKIIDHKKSFISLLITGVLMGAAVIIPVSGMAGLALALGVYRVWTGFLSHPLRALKERARLLLPLIAGILIGSIALNTPLNSLYENYEQQVLWAFSGILIGAMPSVLVRHPIKKGNAGYNSLFFAFMLLIIAGSAAGYYIIEIEAEGTVLLFLLIGFLFGLSALIPGFSPMGLALFFCTDKLLKSNSQLITVAVIAGIAGVLAAMPLSYLIRGRLKSKGFFYSLMGLTAGSIIAMIPAWQNKSFLFINVLILAFSILAGFILCYPLFSAKREEHESLTRSQRKRINLRRKRAAILFAVFAFLIVGATTVTKWWWPVWEQNVFGWLIPQVPENVATPILAVTPPPPTPTPEVIGTPSGPTPTPGPTFGVDDYNFVNENVEIHIEKVQTEDVRYHIAEIKLKSIDNIKTVLAKNWEKGKDEHTSSMAARSGAILAVSGDYFNFDSDFDGLIIRNGIKLYSYSLKRDMLILRRDGSMEVYSKYKYDAADAETIWQSWVFGPILVKDGVVNTDYSNTTNRGLNPRIAIGMIEPLHYVFLAVDGRKDGYEGLRFPELAQIMADKGCTVAFNLDGGGSTTMYFNSKVLSVAQDMGKERTVSDCIIIVP